MADRLVNMKQLVRMLSISRPQVYVMMAREGFPSPTTTSANKHCSRRTAMVWRVYEVERWIAGRVAQRDGTALQPPKRPRGRPRKDEAQQQASTPHPAGL